MGLGGCGMTYLVLDANLNKGFAIKEYLTSAIATRAPDGSVALQASNVRGDFDWGRSGSWKRHMYRTLIPNQRFLKC